jgi:hypothetical protein
MMFAHRDPVCVALAVGELLAAVEDMRCYVERMVTHGNGRRRASTRRRPGPAVNLPARIARVHRDRPAGAAGHGSRHDRFTHVFGTVADGVRHLLARLHDLEC